MKFQSSLDNRTTEQLQAMHTRLEERLEELQKPLWISQEEEYEMQIIKKRKLAIKDKLRDMQ